MQEYSYLAKNLNGEEISGKQDAESVDELKKILYSKGYFLTKTSVAAKEVKFNFKIKKVNLKDFSVFCRQFSVILNSGITVTEAVETLIYQTQNKFFQQVLKEVHQHLLKGKLLSECIKMKKDVFPDFFINMIQVAEASGSLDSVLERMAEYYEKEHKMIKKVKAAMTYPVIVLVVALSVITLLMVKVLPMFAEMLSSMGGEIPLITRLLMSMSNFMVKYYLVIFGVLVVGIISLIKYSKTQEGRYKFDVLKLKFPVIKNITTKVVTAKFARSMGILLKSGIPIITSIDIISNLIGNKVVEEKFRMCAKDIKEGKGIALSIKSIEVFPPLLIQMVSVGERTGELDDMLTRTAKFFDEEVEEAIQQATALIEPAMIIFLAVAVGAIILAVMLPMVNIMQTMSN